MDTRPESMDSNSKVVIGYASIWTPIDFNKIPADKLTHIAYSFLNLNTDDGSIIFGDDGCNKCCAINYLNSLLQLKQTHKHLRIHLSVGGATWVKSFMPVVRDEVKRMKFVTDISDLITTHGLDGVDIDWEYPLPNEGTYFVQLGKDLRAKLGYKYEITAAIPSIPNILKNYNLEEANPIFSWFNLMSYDASVGSTVASHQSPLYHNPLDPIEDASADSAIKSLVSMNVPYSKIVLGIPLYAYQYQVVKNDNNNNGLFQSCTSKCDIFVNNMDISRTSKGNRYFDNIAKAPWYYSPDSGLFTTFEDVDSVQHKINYISSKALKGAMFWELGQDNLDDSSVVTAVADKMNLTLSPTSDVYFPLTVPGIIF
eukprot:NODE_9_length_47730_cov_0.323718.p8 type:complete len:369 gc:universal NODE_9_length_47730_cov_0.323718:38828-37722(-)